MTARPPDDQKTWEGWEGWEDSAVPPEQRGDYLRDLKRLFAEFDYDHPSLYGHFGQECVHTRIPFGLRTAEGVADFRRFLERAADLVVSYGGLPVRRARGRPVPGRTAQVLPTTKLQPARQPQKSPSRSRPWT